MKIQIESDDIFGERDDLTILSLRSPTVPPPQNVFRTTLPTALIANFTPPPPPPPPPPMTDLLVEFHHDQRAAAHHALPPASSPLPSPLHNVRQSRGRRNLALRTEKEKTVPKLYPWFTTQRATVHSMEYLEWNRIVEIWGDVQCKRCDRKFEMRFNLRSEYEKLESFIAENKSELKDRAPRCWVSPVLPRCGFCREENAVRPVIAPKKIAINWLFLLLGQLLGCCTLDQLKYFCKQTGNHRTGAKDRVLYLTYLGLCNQLVPKKLFDPHSR
ncbi:uncharacterized protein LOC133785943 [Humulus lupulus]|uniref:uncharacterized protein LOC133785943 n=1 Tax=Humulus lupulus TaxID=3486 RepID=UPI002B4050A8|nr:uncharacterized protein LOC133785943 [Humulus lupulus]